MAPIRKASPITRQVPEVKSQNAWEFSGNTGFSNGKPIARIRKMRAMVSKAYGVSGSLGTTSAPDNAYAVHDERSMPMANAMSGGYQ